MRGRDERKLDDLKKLIRRLDTAEDANAGSGKPAKRVGYVGSLRAARTDAPRDDASDPLSASDWRGEHGESESRGRSTSSKAVIVGAATAAIVSTVLAIVITSGIVGMRGGQSGEGGSASLLPSFSDGAKRMFGLSETNPTPAELMIKEAVNLINGGNLVAARILLERATGLGSGVAALALGETYDPTRAARLRTGREEVDPAKAREWYQRALALGSGDALSRLAALDGKQ
jgi:hypothetical protein